MAAGGGESKPGPNARYDYAVLPRGKRGRFLEGDSRRECGVAVSFTGQSLDVGAQVTLSRYRGYGNIDAPVFPDALYRSNMADAVWWEPKHSRSYLVLGNSSGDTLKVRISSGLGEPRDVEVGPHATVVRDLHGEEDRDEGVDSVHVEGTGGPGTLPITGYTVSDEERFVNTIRSFDPATSSEGQSTLTGCTFPAGQTIWLSRTFRRSRCAFRQRSFL